MRRDFLIHTAALAGCFEGNSTPAKEILESFGSADVIFEMGRKEAVQTCPPLEKIAHKLFSRERLDAAARDVDWALEHDVEMIAAGDSDYPERLLQCPDPPLLIYKKGRIDFSRPRFIAIVGTRASTQYGRRYTERIVEGLSSLAVKPVIVSGLALGIDTHAHTFALKYGLDTVAVMATGFDTLYPPSNDHLAAEILQHGALVTEFSPFVPSFPINFVRRNRIIAGLSDCTLVVESKAKGGGLITAQMAQDYNRSVFAVPGRIDDNTFRGCNQIIEDNVAAIVSGAGSIIRAMGWDTADAALPLVFSDIDEDSLKGRILKFLLENPESEVREIAFALETTPQNLALPLLELEMAGRIAIVSGNKYRIK
ncbi:MAG: DNA-processing protein DprA [Bacteroidales bacterium]|nr:DNA-processing protein DprA [Bacteroidales bacterium]